MAAAKKIPRKQEAKKPERRYKPKKKLATPLATPTPEYINPWEKLNLEHLRGADYAYRLLRTSPVIRGEALKLLDGQIVDVRAEIQKKLDNLCIGVDPKLCEKCTVCREMKKEL